MLIMCILGIGIDCTFIFTSFIEEIKMHYALPAVLVALATDEPVVRTFGLTRHGDIVGRLCLKIFCIVPVACHVTYEAERIHVFGIVFRQVCGHLKRAVHRDIQCQLPCEGSMNEVGIFAPVLQLCLQNTRSVIHRTALQTRERQNTGMVGARTSESLILCSACTLVTNEIRIGATKSGRTCCLMCIYHDTMLCGFLYNIQIMIVH